MATKKPAPKLPAKPKQPDKLIPKYHIDHKNWDKEAVMMAIAEKMLSSSKGLAYICRDNSEFPNIATVFRWFMAEKSAGVESPICDIYESAKSMQIDYMADEINEIADNEVANPVLVDGLPLQIDGKLVTVVDGPSVQHARLRCDNRKWIAAKLKHRKYGEKLELGGDPERPLSGIQDKDLEAQILILMRKMQANGIE